MIILSGVCTLSFLASQYLTYRKNVDLPSVGSGQFLPWQVELTNKGTSRVFGLEIGQSNLKEAEAIFRDNAELTLFASPGGKFQLEAYFDKVVLAGFGAKIVLTLDLTQDELSAFYGRGNRLSRLSGGRQKVNIAPDDLNKAYRAPISSLTYLTQIKIDSEFLYRRFGKADSIYHERSGNIEHWMYASKGLDVAFDNMGNAVFQYVNPRHFNDLTIKLLSGQGQFMD